MVPSSEIRENLVQVPKLALIPGETVWWPFGPTQWGKCIAEKNKWYPSAVLMAERDPILVQFGLNPIAQTLLDEDGHIGDCLRASLATLLGISLENIPHFALFNSHWMHVLELWCSQKNLAFEESHQSEGLAILVGQSPRGTKHACVGFTGEVIWDPHPSRSGLSAVDYHLVFEPEKTTFKEGTYA